MGKIIVLFLLLHISIFGLNVTQLGKIDSILSIAETSYDSQNYNKSLELYMDVNGMLDSLGNAKNDHILSNIGISYYKLDSIAKSIYYFEKAYKINPYNSRNRENLSVLYKRVMGENIVDTDIIYVIYKFFNPFIVKILKSFIVLILFINLLSLIIKKIKSKPINRTFLISNFVFIIAIAIYLFIYTFYVNSFSYGVISKDSSFYSEPINGRVIGNLFTGHKVRVIKKDENMIFFNYKNKITGWIEKDNLLITE